MQYQQTTMFMQP